MIDKSSPCWGCLRLRRDSPIIFDYNEDVNQNGGSEWLKGKL